MPPLDLSPSEPAIWHKSRIDTGDIGVCRHLSYAAWIEFSQIANEWDYSGSVHSWPISDIH